MRETVGMDFQIPHPGTTPDDAHADVARRAAACAARIPPAPVSFATDLSGFDALFHDLTAAVCRLDPRFDFDREGRPAAIRAIRAALPSVEREILDAVLEDHACELAATREALYQIALANGRGRVDERERSDRKD